MRVQGGRENVRALARTACNNLYKKNPGDMIPWLVSNQLVKYEPGQLQQSRFCSLVDASLQYANPKHTEIYNGITITQL